MLSATFLDDISEEDIDRTFVEKARTDILAFTKYTKLDYVIGWHHRYLAAKLNAFVRGEIKYLMVFMPPRHGKSELVSRKLPAFLHGLYPDAEIMAASYNDSLAGEMCMAVQSVMDSPEYKKIFPGITLPPARVHYTQGMRSSDGHTIVGRRGKYRGQGVGGSFTGKGANFIIIDDPIKGREIADSPTYREKLWSFYNDDLFSRLETDLKNGRPGQVLLTQTRWHEDDLSGRLLELMAKDPKATQWEIINFPAIRVDRENPEDPREIGESLWPAKYSVEQLERIKAGQTVRGWSSLYQQNPIPNGSGLFKDQMFEFRPLPDEFDYKFTTADTAYKEKEENDYQCISAWGVYQEELYLIDTWKDKMMAVDVEEPFKNFISRHQSYGFRYAWIEPKGHGIYLNQKFARDNIPVPDEDNVAEFFKDRRLDKVERASNVVPHLNGRKVYVNENLSTGKECVAEALAFPKVKHDDFTDTLIDAVKIVYSGKASILDVL